MNYTYMVKCADGTLYTGWTNCLEKRLKAHNSGRNGAKYTKDALETVISTLQSKGYEFVTLSELVYKDHFHMDPSGKQIPD